MANITPRKNKDGVITSYTIRVYHGYDKTGKRLKPYTMSYKPAPNMTARQIEKELNRQAVQFEEQCKQGYSLDNRQTFAEYAEYVLKCKQESGVKWRTIERYRELLERINAGIGHIKLADLRPQHLSGLYTQLRQQGIRKGNGRAFPTADIKVFAMGAGISKVKLLELSGVSLTTLSTVYSGKSVSEQAAEKICKALSVPIGKLFKVEQDSRPLSEKTILEHHRLISTILAYAEKEMLVQYNAAEKVVNKPKTKRVKDINYFELADLEKMRDCLASVLCLNGVDITTISKWLGHKNVTTTVNNVKGHKNQSSYITIKSVTFKGNTLTFITTNNCMTCTLIFLKYKR